MFRQILQFLTRWAANCVGLAVSAMLSIITIEGTAISIIISAFVLALLNAIVKPLLIILTLPLIALTLGFFLIVINGIIMYVLSLLYSEIVISNIWMAMVAGIVIGLVNYIVTFIYERFVSNE